MTDIRSASATSRRLFIFSRLTQSGLMTGLVFALAAVVSLALSTPAEAREQDRLIQETLAQNALYTGLAPAEATLVHYGHGRRYYYPRKHYRYGYRYPHRYYRKHYKRRYYGGRFGRKKHHHYNWRHYRHNYGYKRRHRYW